MILLIVSRDVQSFFDFTTFFLKEHLPSKLRLIKSYRGRWVDVCTDCSHLDFLMIGFVMMELNLNDLNDVDQLMLNARLRDEIEPYLDESVTMIDTARMPTSMENEFLASMIAWERAPILPLSQWFTPELKLLDCARISDEALSQELHQVIGRLFEKNIILSDTEHLSDRQLYQLIGRSILPSMEKQISIPGRYLRWQCYDEVADEDIWLTYYASDQERNDWEAANYETAPARRSLPFSRKMPQPHN